MYVIFRYIYDLSFGIHLGAASGQTNGEDNVLMVVCSSLVV